MTPPDSDEFGFGSDAPAGAPAPNPLDIPWPPPQPQGQQQRQTWQARRPDAGAFPQPQNMRPRPQQGAPQASQPWPGGMQPKPQAPRPATGQRPAPPRSQQAQRPQAPAPRQPQPSEAELLEAGQRINHLHQLATIGEVSAGVLHEARNLLTGVVPPYLRHHTGGHMCDGAGPVKKLLDLVRPGVPTFQGDEKARVQHDFFHAEDFTRQRTRRPRNR